MNKSGLALALAWPETECKQTGAWYDALMYFLGVNRKGYYKVGHAAIVLIEKLAGQCHYFDFGRYHAPKGFGRVRSAVTDHDLQIGAKASFSPDGKELLNTDEILEELSQNPSTHGDGTTYCACIEIKIKKAYQKSLQLQKLDFIRYGPFIPKGTNCSRFVNTILMSAGIPFWNRILLAVPWMLTPTPMWNLQALNSKVLSFGKTAEATSNLVKPEIVISR